MNVIEKYENLTEDDQITIEIYNLCKKLSDNNCCLCDEDIQLLNSIPIAVLLPFISKLAPAVDTCPN